jgi:hypothetical protein
LNWHAGGDLAARAFVLSRIAPPNSKPVKNQSSAPR